MRHSKLRDHQKNIPSKNKWLHMLRRSSYAIYLLRCFESCNIHGIKKCQRYKIENLKNFKTNFWSFYRNNLLKLGRRNSSQMILIYKQYDTCQNKYYPDNLNLISFYRHISYHVLMFTISLSKRNLNEKFGQFSRRQKTEIYLPRNICLS